MSRDSLDSSANSPVVRDNTFVFVADTTARVSSSPQLPSSPHTWQKYILLFKNYLVMQTLVSTNAHAGFEVVAPWGLAPSAEAQNLRVPFWMMGIAATLTAVGEIANYHYAKKNANRFLAAHDYIFSALSSPFLFLLGLIPGIASLPMEWFLVATSVLWLISAVLMSTWTSPDSRDHMIISSPEDPKTFPPLPEPSQWGRRMNIAAFGNTVIFSWTALLSTLVRELYGKTMPLPPICWAVIGCAFYRTMSIGANIHKDQQKAHAFLALHKGLIEEGAFIYYGLSGLASLSIYNACGGTFCVNDATHNALTAACFLFATGLGHVSEATKEFDFKKQHERNLAIENAVKNAYDGLCQKKENFSKACVAGFEYAGNKISACCVRDVPAEAQGLVPS